MNPVASSNSDEDTEGEGDIPYDSAEPTSREKAIMGSTGIANLRLVRRLLRKHNQDQDYVVELLVEWMAADQSSDDQWWAEDGPDDYKGPRNKPGSESEPEKAIKDGSPSEPTEAETEAPAVDGESAKEPVTPSPTHQKPTPAGRPVKGAARQKKAESKKRQKELAKMKKRQAAREATAAVSAPGGSSTTKADVDSSAGMRHINI
ncbi:hypothetical protein GGF46_001010 [Coemansia sp. RSA 552]|nr:hypothetical protein GGF46_001010 [Coemansia sp. RSA 552]